MLKNEHAGAICRVRLNSFFYIVAVCAGIKELGIAVKLKADIKEFAVIVIIIADGAHTGKGLVDASVAVFQNKGIYNPAVIKDDDSVFKRSLIVDAEGRKGKLLAFELSFSVEGYIKAGSVINCAGSIAAELKIAPFGIFIRLAKAVIHGRAKIFSCSLFAFLTAGAKTECFRLRLPGDLRISYRRRKDRAAL